MATIKLLLQSIRNRDLTCSLSLGTACKKDSVEKKRKHTLKRHIPVMNHTSHNHIFSGNFHMHQSKSVKTPDGTERLHYSWGLRGSTRGPIPCPLPAAGFLNGGLFYYRTVSAPFVLILGWRQLSIKGYEGTGTSRKVTAMWKIEVAFTVKSFPSFSYRILFPELVKSSSLKFKVYYVFFIRGNHSSSRHKYKQCRLQLQYRKQPLLSFMITISTLKIITNSHSPEFPILQKC